ncbi:MAG: STAS/SEC14 domain-containing protein [Elainella sp. C42_A2020_010]|nr:STAS/SEC14 domain-containing protein [Elainella sp. C42_A2020_010]
MQASTEQLLKAIEQLPQSELEAFVAEVLKLRAQRQVPHLSTAEAEILAKINQCIPQGLQQRFEQLVMKRQQLTITEAELAELIQMTDRIEAFNVERIQALAELAQLRDQSLTEVMQSLGIQPPACV